MKSMLDYIVAFPDRLHHPKEDEYVYRVLREREPSTAATLDELQDEHRRGPDVTRTMVDALEAYRRDAGAFEAFAQAVSSYAEFQWAHMRKEEEVILPIAQKALLPADWIAIDAAFRSNADPLVGVDTQREFRELFRRVVNLMPAPMGLGPERPDGQLTKHRAAAAPRARPPRVPARTIARCGRASCLRPARSSR